MIAKNAKGTHNHHLIDNKRLEILVYRFSGVKSKEDSYQRNLT